MNLYKVLNDDYREFKLHESAVKRTRISRRRNSRVTLKESTEVNVSNNGDSTDVNIVIDNKKSAEPIAPVVSDEVTAEVEEPVEDLSLEEESDKVACKGKDCKGEECDESCGSKKVKESAEDNARFWDSPPSVGDSINSTGAGEVEILDLDKGSDYLLLKRPSDGDFQAYVAAWCPSYDEDGNLFWGQGHYFNSEDEAKDYFDGVKVSEQEVVSEAEEVEDVEVSDEEVDSEESNGPTKAADKLEEIIRILDEEGSVDPDIVRNNISVAMEWLEPYIKDSDEEATEEPLEECEVKAFNVVRMSPVANLYMIEADKSDNSRVYIVGRNFNTKTNMLDEAEVFDNKTKATTKFRDVLYSVKNSKKGE